MKIHENAEILLRTLNSKGYDAYLVGGCVRDAIMGKNPHDWDICTSALPEEVKEAFPNYHVIETGLQHGTVTILINRVPFEVTSYRTEGVYKDNRRPSEVHFVKDLKEDLARRDFTVNALAYHPDEGIIDYFNGIKDIENRVLRSVGNPNERFEEDALRILRALRFASRLGFNISKDLEKAIHEKKSLLQHISQERIYSEFVSILSGDNVVSILLSYRDVIAIFIPEIVSCFDYPQHNPYHQYDVYRHSIESVGLVENGIVLRLTMFFHDIGKPQRHTTDEEGIDHFYQHSEVSVDITRKILKRLKIDNETKKDVLELILYHDASISEKKILRWLNRLGERQLYQLLKVKRADILAQADYKRTERLLELDELKSAIDHIIENGNCFSLQQLAIDGRDLIALGVSEGVAIGKILNQLLEMVLNEEIINDKEVLSSEVKKIIK